MYTPDRPSRLAERPVGKKSARLGYVRSKASYSRSFETLTSIDGLSCTPRFPEEKTDYHYLHNESVYKRVTTSESIDGSRFYSTKKQIFKPRSTLSPGTLTQHTPLTFHDALYLCIISVQEFKECPPLRLLLC